MVPSSENSPSEQVQILKRPRVLAPQKAKALSEMQAILNQLLGWEKEVVKLLDENRRATEVLRAELLGLMEESP